MPFFLNALKNNTIDDIKIIGTNHQAQRSIPQ
jgi:hypothetical protein